MTWPGRPHAALVIGLLLVGAGAVSGQPATRTAKNGPAPPHNAPSGDTQSSLTGWQRLYKGKGGSVYLQYDLPDPFSRVYTWRFRSTFDHPVHVDYRIDAGTRNGFPSEFERTAYLPAHGKTDRLGIPAYLQPSISVEQVR